MLPAFVSVEMLVDGPETITPTPPGLADCPLTLPPPLLIVRGPPLPDTGPDVGVEMVCARAPSPDIAAPAIAATDTPASSMRLDDHHVVQPVTLVGIALSGLRAKNAYAGL
jgi:hypothetical protein